jgi:hypothetical protein
MIPSCKQMMAKRRRPTQRHLVESLGTLLPEQSLVVAMPGEGVSGRRAKGEDERCGEVEREERCGEERRQKGQRRKGTAGPSEAKREMSEGEEGKTRREEERKRREELERKRKRAAPAVVSVAVSEPLVVAVRERK